MNQECQLLFFRLRETSGSENQSLSWRSRGIQVTIYQWCCYLFIVIMFLIFGYFKICAQNLYIFRTDCGKKWKISLCKLRRSHVTDGDQFLNRGISFSLRKPTRWKIYLRQPQNPLTSLSVKIAAADQLRIYWSSVSSLNPGLSNR